MLYSEGWGCHIVNISMYDFYVELVLMKLKCNKNKKYIVTVRKA